MLNRKRLTFGVLILIIIISVRFLPGCGQGLKILTEITSGGTGAGVDWTEWSYRRSVTVSNSGTAMSDYQVNIQLDNSNFSFANADPDGDDIRFNLNGSSLSYWIESWDSVTTHTASVWVKVPSITASGNTVMYLYYGNPGMSAASDFDNTFTKNSGFAGLAAHWHMDEGSGTSIGDSSGNANDGAISDAAWLAADGGRWFTDSTAGFSSGDSLSFNGSSSYVTVSDSDDLDVGSITISAWIKTSADVSTTQFIVSKWSEAPTHEKSYGVYVGTNMINFITSNDGDLNQHTTSGGLLSVNTWYHVAVSFNGAQKVIYINGSQVISDPLASTIYSGTSYLLIGRRNLTVSNYFNGIIDEVSIYNTALTSDQIKALSQRRKDSPDVGDTPVVGIEENVP